MTSDHVITYYAAAGMKKLPSQKWDGRSLTRVATQIALRPSTEMPLKRAVKGAPSRLLAGGSQAEQIRRPCRLTPPAGSLKGKTDCFLHHSRVRSMNVAIITWKINNSRGFLQFCIIRRKHLSFSGGFRCYSQSPRQAVGLEFRYSPSGSGRPKPIFSVRSPRLLSYCCRVMAPRSRKV